jgi:SAM-dependent methyltransferase
MSVLLWPHVMCNKACIDFGRQYLSPEEIAGREVLEVGSYDDNGSLRSLIGSWRPARYVGADVYFGPGVDVVCDAESLVQRFGPDSFDVVLSTEMLEHVKDWRTVIANLKAVLRPSGSLLITTRSHGYPYHGAPFDCWRFEVDDMHAIFADFEIEAVESDALMPGVFIKARKPLAYTPVDLSAYAMHSMAVGRRAATVSDAELRRFMIAQNGLLKYAHLRLRQGVSSITPVPLKRLKRRVCGERI